jgi:hypothetical protein
MSDETVASLTVSDRGISETGSSLAYGRGGVTAATSAGPGSRRLAEILQGRKCQAMLASKVRRTLTLLLLGSWLQGKTAGRLSAAKGGGDPCNRTRLKELN